MAIDITTKKNLSAEFSEKAGCKQADIGFFPRDWEIKKFNKIGQVIDGDRGVNYPSSNHFLLDGDCLFLSAKNVTKKGFKFNDCVFISKDRDSLLGQGKLKMWDVVLTTRGTVGNFAYFDSAVPFENIRINSGMVILRKESDKVVKEYLYEILKSQIIENQICRVVFGSAQPQLTVKIVNNLQVPYPEDKFEQTAIATVLSDTDVLIGRLEKLIAKKKDIKQGTMQQLLTGKKRLPGFSGEWEVMSFDQIVSRTTGAWGSQDCDDNHSRCAEIIRAGDISSEGMLMATALRFLSEVEFSKARCHLDDLVITTSGTGLGKVWWCDGRANVVASNFVRVLCPIKSKAQGRFLFYVLRSEEALRQLHEHTATSAYPNLRLSFFSARWVSLPSVSEQAAIATVLSDMDVEIESLEQKRNKYVMLKQGMMQQLLTGKIRIHANN